MNRNQNYNKSFNLDSNAGEMTEQRGFLTFIPAIAVYFLDSNYLSLPLTLYLAARIEITKALDSKHKCKATQVISYHCFSQNECHRVLGERRRASFDFLYTISSF